MTSFTTDSRTYVVHQDLGDGAFIISGHPRYCPTPSKVLFLRPLVVGDTAFFRVLSGQYPHLGNRVETTIVRRIE